MSQVAMLAWIFGDCREGRYVPVAHVWHRPKRSVDQRPGRFHGIVRPSLLALFSRLYLQQLSVLVKCHGNSGLYLKLPV